MRRTENVKHKTLHPRATHLGYDRDITKLLHSESKSKIFIPRCLRQKNGTGATFAYTRNLVNNCHGKHRNSCSARQTKRRLSGHFDRGKVNFDDTWRIHSNATRAQKHFDLPDSQDRENAVAIAIPSLKLCSASPIKFTITSGC